MEILKCLIILVITVAINAEKKSFVDSKLYKVVPKTNTEVTALESLRDAEIGDFWNEYFRVNDDVRVVVPKELQAVFVEKLTQANAEVKIIIEDVQKAIDDQLKPKAQRSNTFLSMDWDSYHNLADIEAWMDELVREYPNIVSPVTMAIRSVEGREIKGIRIDYSPSRQKPLAMIEGALHAREWISPATVTWITKELLTSDDPDVRIMAENLEWHIFPVVNPDGYVYTFTNHRMWRKNRSTFNFTTCANADNDMSNGVDLNRNFDFYWMQIGASDNPCLNTFAGPSAASEPETQAISQYILSLRARGDLVYYLSFHSYTQLFILPYSHVFSPADYPADNHDHLVEIGLNSATRIAERYNTTFRVGTAVDVLYPMSGSSFDWAKLYGNASISYLIELRDLGEYGFLLPPEQILPSSLEIMDGVIALDSTTRRLGYYSAAASAVLSATLILSVMAVTLFC